MCSDSFARPPEGRLSGDRGNPMRTGFKGSVHTSVAASLWVGLAVLAWAGAARAAPANDHCDDATVVTDLPFTDVISTSDATRDSEDPLVCSINVGSNVWYRYTSTRARTLCVRTALSDYGMVS